MSAVFDTPTLTVPLSGRDHVIGPETASVTLLEYGDYECPFCRAAEGSVEQLLQVAGDEMRYAYRHFPLSQIHAHAQQAAEAAEAAAEQGEFWEMHRLLFARQDRLGLRDLLGYAAALGLDVRRFATELEAHVHAPRVREDFMSGVRSGVNGTPTFFVNGRRHNGGYDVGSLLAALRSAESSAA
jgi:protein-disulfide isomerase